MRRGGGGRLHALLALSLSKALLLLLLLRKAAVVLLEEAAALLLLLLLLSSRVRDAARKTRSRAVAGALQETRGEERQGAWNGAGSVEFGRETSLQEANV